MGKQALFTIWNDLFLTVVPAAASLRASPAAPTGLSRGSRHRARHDGDRILPHPHSAPGRIRGVAPQQDRLTREWHRKFRPGPSQTAGGGA